MDSYGESLLVLPLPFLFHAPFISPLSLPLSLSVCIRNSTDVMVSQVYSRWSDNIHRDWFSFARNPKSNLNTETVTDR